MGALLWRCEGVRPASRRTWRGTQRTQRWAWWTREGRIGILNHGSLLPGARGLARPGASSLSSLLRGTLVERTRLRLGHCAQGNHLPTRGRAIDRRANRKQPGRAHEARTQSEPNEPSQVHRHHAELPRGDLDDRQLAGLDQAEERMNGKAEVRGDFGEREKRVLHAPMVQELRRPVERRQFRSIVAGVTGAGAGRPGRRPGRGPST
jgi:hypothetical protein